nr:hypothetical protein [Tanacetum cinerariifolium]
HFGFHDQRTPARVQHRADARDFAIRDAAHVVDLALHGHALLVEAVGTGTGQPHGDVDETEQRATVHDIAAIAQMRLQGQCDLGHTVAEPYQLAAQGLEVSAFGQAFRNVHQRFFSCLALANSDAMALLAGAAVAVSLRGALLCC